jgi:antitoxin HicB
MATTHLPHKVHRGLDDYLKLPYRIVLTPDVDDEGRRGFVAEVAELPGCISQGESADEAIRNIYDAMQGWLSVALDDGLEIPEPIDNERFSGKFVARLPRSLHAELVRIAEQEGVSLNQFVVAALASATGWRVPTRTSSTSP